VKAKCVFLGCWSGWIMNIYIASFWILDIPHLGEIGCSLCHQRKRIPIVQRFRCIRCVSGKYHS
jgi:hypothetical protein